MDVSKWQQHLVLPAIFKQNPDIRFCICRTGDGKDLDHWFPKFYQQTMDNNVIPGSYHYFRADRDGRTQAESMSEALGRAGFVPGRHLPPAVDFEDGASLNLPGGVYNGAGKVLPIHQVHEELLEFLTELEKLCGVVPMLYTGQTFHWWMSQAQPELAKEYAKYPLWTPSYTSNHDKYSPRLPADAAGNAFPWAKPTIWQYTGEGKLEGARAKLDLNVFFGTEVDLAEFCSRSLVIPPPAPVVEHVHKPTVAEVRALDRVDAALAELNSAYDALGKARQC